MIIIFISGLIVIGCVLYQNKCDGSLHGQKIFLVSVPVEVMDCYGIMKIKETYKRETRNHTIIAILCLGIISFVPLKQYSIFAYIVYFIALFPFIEAPLKHANLAMKQLKKSLGWTYKKPIKAVDLGLHEYANKAMLSPILFVLPCLLEVTTIFITNVNHDGLMNILAFINLLIVIFGYLGIKKLPNKTICDNHAVNLQLNKQRKHYYSLFLFFITFLDSILNFFFSYFSNDVKSITGFLLLCEIGLFTMFTVFVFYSFHQMFQQERKLIQQAGNLYLEEDEDDYWIVGVFGTTYHNPFDHELIKTSPSGMNIILNTGKMSVKITIFMFVLGVCAFLSYIFAYPFYLDVSNQLVDVKQQQNNILIDSPFYDKMIAVQDITKVTLYEELPKGKRVFGTDAIVYAKGKYTFDTIGECNMYIASNHKPFIYVETKEEHIIFNDDNEQQTRKLYESIQKEIKRRTQP